MQFLQYLLLSALLVAASADFVALQTDNSTNMTVSNMVGAQRIANYASKITPSSDNVIVASKTAQRQLSTISSVIIGVVVAAVCLVIAVILSALFVMRRRFSTWRLTGGKSDVATSDDATDGANTALTGEAKCITCEVNEKADLIATDKLETEKAEAAKGGVADNAETKANDGSEEPTVTENQPQASPSSDSPLLEPEVAAETKKEDAPDAKTSSSSLIASVLNDLSESVSSKLLNSKSPTKCAENPINE